GAGSGLVVGRVVGRRRSAVRDDDRRTLVAEPQIESERVPLGVEGADQTLTDASSGIGTTRAGIEHVSAVAAVNPPLIVGGGTRRITDRDRAPLEVVGLEEALATPA